ncbi:MAG: DAK2 domain-containing protein [Lachnospiraceae bacterium]|nr:DAK2 domain-containing protein [Lachnospiraceae bacterium]
MSTKTLDAVLLSKMFLAGAAELSANKERINELNVFPVPDGDTGTNMTLTIMSAAKEVLALGDEIDMPALCKAISMGSLRGARGNSGVILSQLLRGFTKELKEHETVDIPRLAIAFNKACETAYKAVMKPKEGTILTVARGAAEKMSELSDKVEDIESLAKGVVEHSEYVLSQTPELLPVLKQAGVVDSGGQGLVCVLTGAKKALMGETGDFTAADLEAATGVKASGINREAVANAEVKYGYCTEFIIMLNHVFNQKTEADFKAYLESIGDSIVCVSYEDIVKVHVHTNHPGLAFEKALGFGALTSMKVDNMREEHQERLFKLDGGKYVERPESEMEYTGQAGTANGPIRGAIGSRVAASQLETEKIAEAGIPDEDTSETDESLIPDEDTPQKEYGFIAVSAGNGMNEIFKNLGVDEIISGGQTMNPSTDDILDAIGRVNADTVFVLPNNKNIILAANQASSLIEDKKVIVIPSKTLPQGISALISFMPGEAPEDNEEAMKEAIGNVKTGEVTYSVRDTEIDGFIIKQHDIMGIGDKGILAVGTEIIDTAFEMVYRMVDEDSSLISIYYGEDINESEASVLRVKIEETFPDLEIELHEGGEPVYYYIISVE